MLLFPVSSALSLQHERERKVRRKYDKKFKLMVVNLCLSGQDSKEIASEMELDRSMVQRWVREHHMYSGNSFKGNGNAVMTS